MVCTNAWSASSGSVKPLASCPRNALEILTVVHDLVAGIINAEERQVTLRLELPAFLAVDFVRRERLCSEGGLARVGDLVDYVLYTHPVADPSRGKEGKRSHNAVSLLEYSSGQTEYYSSLWDETD